MCSRSEAEPCSQPVLYDFSSTGTKAKKWSPLTLGAGYSCPFLTVGMMREQRKELYVKFWCALAVPQWQREAGALEAERSGMRRAVFHLNCVQKLPITNTPLSL